MPRLPRPLLVYVGLAVSLLGVLPVMGALGIFGDEVSVAGVIFGLLFGIVFGGAGGTLVYRTLSRIMEDRLGGAQPFLRGLGRLLLLQVSRRTLTAAAPQLGLALLIVWLLIDPDGPPLVDRADLRHLVLLEFFAIHSTAFLGLIALAWWSGAWKVLQVLLFCAFLGLYGYGAHTQAGLAGAVGFGVLTLNKYLGYALRPPGLMKKIALGLRWFTGMMVFLLVAGAFDVDLERADNLGFAATYFAVLALFEAFDLLAPIGPEPERSVAMPAQSPGASSAPAKARSL